eukprot:TRINITY_DN11540_c0_g1_i2.p1 TRINITY_DN11540_c0_g1~~TRINITY_DN11540_c0_g1_i2.p1  ORF type:complete len:557 (+),score=301.76 TRINITY_DN11540_c0_g1_i2:106-1671(+)
MADKLTRIAIVKEDKCKPKRCKQECRKHCPPVKMGKLCIDVKPISKIAFISEELCIGCGICVKKCPFSAIQIINLPKNLERDTTHRYGPNSFKLHRLPTPRPGQVLGLVGTNGIGKSTALKVLSGKLKPNLGRFTDPPEWDEILTYFRGSELQNYFTKILEDNLKALIKPQYVDHIPRAVKGNVGAVLASKNDKDKKEDLIEFLELTKLTEREVKDLSGGELQRFAIAVVAIQKADIFIPTENLRFRDSSLNFKVSDTDFVASRVGTYKYPDMVKTLGGFKLTIKSGDFSGSEIVVMLGQNGTGKTTFIRMLAGIMKSDTDEQVPELRVSYKPQKISPKFEGTVRQLLHQKIRASLGHPQFQSDVYKPLQIENLIDQEVIHLSGGELQRVAIALALGQPADVYLIDEPSAYLDSEQRIIAAKVIKRFVMHSRKTAFIVEHDFIMATYLADKVVVYEGIPSIDCTANTPQDLLSGMNLFLSQLQITFRRDPTNFRPRINKFDSVKDREQKSTNNYFFLEADD